MPTIEVAIFTDIDAMQNFALGGCPTEAGALVSFVGVVRDHDGDRLVKALEYVGHPTAAEVLRTTAVTVARQHRAVLSVRLAHRVGLLAVGDHALIAEVTAAHRGDAFAACADLVEEVKRVLPVWKRQIFADDTEEWVNCP